MTSETGGLVAAGNLHTAEAAASVLRAGGNAFDAIIAALWTACVAEPVLCSLGGGGFLMACEEGKAPEVIDFFADTPLVKLPARTLDFELITADFGTVHQEFHTGQGSVATPGFVAGLFAIHRRHASMPMPELVVPAIELATKGHPLDPLQAYILDVVHPIMLRTPEAQRLYRSRKRSKTPQPMQQGELFKNLDLANAMERIAKEGSDLFYNGELAEIIAHEQSEKGLITKDDLSGYRVAVREPVSTTLNGTKVFTNPLPSSGGTMVALQLQLLSSLSSDNLAHPTRRALALTQAMETANRARHESGFAGSPDEDSAHNLFSPDYFKSFLSALQGRAEKAGGTTHISVVDGKGNVAAATASNGEGCGHIVPGTGIMLNNMLGEEDINPNGFFNWECGIRISSMMAPTLLAHPDGAMTVLGSGGSNRIRTAIFQVAAALIFGGSNAREAVDAPRLHFERGLLHIEGGNDEAIVEVLNSSYEETHEWQDKNLFFGGVHVASRQGDSFDGAADPRRGGVMVRV